MKKQVIRLVISLLLLVGACSIQTHSDGLPVPMCVPGKNC
jgi:hypothetical protein